MVFDPRTSLRELDPPPRLQLGDVQWSVKLLRRLLALFGYGPPAWLDPALPVPAEFDNDLSTLVGAFQIRFGLDPSGAADGPTWAAFLENPPPGGTQLADGRLAIEMRIVEV